MKTSKAIRHAAFVCLGLTFLVSIDVSVGARSAYAESTGLSSWPMKGATIQVPQGMGRTYMQAASAKGDVIVGFAVNTDDAVAIRWTAQTGIKRLRIVGTTASRAFNVSPDGSAISGGVDFGEGKSQGFLWTDGKGVRKFGSGWRRVETSGISDKGDLVVGTFWKQEFDPHAFYRTEVGSVQSLADDPMFQAMKLTDTAAMAVSGDGSTIVGWAADYDRQRVIAYRWTRARGARYIADIGGGDNITRWMGVSRDGETVVGTAFDSASRGAHGQAFRWSEKEGLQTLIQDSDDSVALGMSADGSRVFGMYGVGTEMHFFVWTSDHGVRDVGTIDRTTPQPVIAEQAILFPYQRPQY